MSEIEPYQPDLDAIKRIEVDSFYLKRKTELVKKLDEIKARPDQKKWLWIIYGWLLNTADEAEKLKPFISDIPVLGFILKYYCMLMKWQAKRLSQ